VYISKVLGAVKLTFLCGVIDHIVN